MSNISISRDGQELGTWSAVDIQRMLQGGVLSSADYFWQEGMAEWSTLDRFVPPRATVESFPVIFGSTWAVDQLGFVRAGEVKLTATSIEYVGHRLWPGWARVLVFLVATVVGWFILGAITNTFERAIQRDGGALFYWLAACMGIFTLVGTPLLVLTLMPYFCTTVATLRIDHAAIREPIGRGRGVSFLALLAGGKPRRTRFRAVSAAAATKIAGTLGSGVISASSHRS